MTETLSGDINFIPQGLDNPPSDPINLLNIWIEQAKRFGVREPLGFALSTVSQTQEPSSRVVLMKEVNDTGVIFGSSIDSTKGQDIKNNHHVSGNLWWRETLQQICFQGEIRTLPDEQSDFHFLGRPREAQAVAVESKQSEILTDETDLKKQVLGLIKSDKSIPRPKSWHVFHIRITTIEFWHGSQDRFHRRLKYCLNDDKWQYERLQP